MTGRWAILDTDVYIDHWEGRVRAAEIERVREGFIVRHSAVVLSELRRGARDASSARLVDALYHLARPCWEPTPEDWWLAGRLIRTIGDAHAWENAKRREFQNDALIALTAKRHGATVVTRNERDFRLLARAVPFGLLVV